MTSLPENPWLVLPDEPPFVLPSDRDLIDEFNAKANDGTRIVTSLRPEPFVGSLSASVVLLSLNPGYSEADNHQVHARRSFADGLLRTIRGEGNTFPFYYLDPNEEGKGHDWWRKRLAPVLSRAPLETVVQKLLCVEYFPYHSKRFSPRIPSLPSQQFGFSVVRSAMKRGAIIIFMRAERRWNEAIPELGDYAKRFTLRSPQNVTISENNCPKGFAAILKRLTVDE